MSVIVILKGNNKVQNKNTITLNHATIPNMLPCACKDRRDQQEQLPLTQTLDELKAIKSHSGRGHALDEIS